MEIVKIIVTIIFVILCIALTVIVLMQEGKQDGLGALSGTTDTYYSKNKGRTREGALEKFTRIAAVLFFVISLVLNLKWFN